MNLIGQKFGRLTVLMEDLNPIYKSYYPYWLCECDCKDGTIKSYRQDHLIREESTSCGCLTRENKRKFNTYNLTGEYGIGLTTNTNKEFYFDLEDYDLIKDWCWIEDIYGYITTRESRTNTHKVILLHRMVMNAIDKNIEIDHQYHVSYDNRKEYLREVNRSKNQQNRAISKYNTSGVKGVSWSKKENKWRAYLRYNENRIEKRFDTFEEAVKYRKYLEEKYHGEYAYQEPPPEYLKELELN